MAEAAYTVASDIETAGEEKSSDFPEIAIGIDVGTSQCSLAVWNGSAVELLRNTRNQKLMKSFVTFKDESLWAELLINFPMSMKCYPELPSST